MRRSIHADILKRALSSEFSRGALEEIIAFNLEQDDILTGQIGHDEYHFDNNAFEKSRAFMEDQRALIAPALENGDAGRARRAFGRLTHTAQDFYAHSNYVDLWLSCQPDGLKPAPSEIDPLDDALIESPALRSGKLYYPLEALAFIRPLKKLIVPLLPRDSHAWMNLDSAERGPLFEYAFDAAVKRTRYEFDVTIRNFSPALLALFRDLSSDHAA
jgi:hypothetical protein